MDNQKDNKFSRTWVFISQNLEKGIPVMLLYVLESRGSSPGRQGFFMAVNSNGEMRGSIGGGIMEYKFVEMAKEELRSLLQKPRTASIKKQVHDKLSAKNRSGMICSGEQTVLIYPIQPVDGPHIKKIIACLNGMNNGQLELSPRGIRFDDRVPVQNFDFKMQSGAAWVYIEKLGYKNQLYIVGGGHCALSFSNLMRQLDFYIRVYDDRKELKTLQENEWTHEKHFIDDYAELTNLIPAGSAHYVVIMTQGYRTDTLALRALRNKAFKYLGILGSKSKIEKMFDNFRKDDINNEWLSGIHAPVGVPVKSQTPEEIAISIAAEIISIKNGDL